ncbi:hypothetical protein [Massilia endophytica]|uniref:hypothetical protein n=1 Tax=Massilia endophytica TaxID=2899220 RepID=UPI001E425594|nr:hypothetical protein [Massilia endophytica]UGQ48125.1 hypothetical protein LSQ66_06555 [Massilia endophytica]
MKKLSILVLCLIAVAASAAPAPWFLWQSTVDGSKVCSQYPLGKGWEKFSGPFRDSRCTELIPRRLLGR